MTQHSDASGRPWLADQEIKVGVARSVLEEQFPQLAPVSLRHLGTGWDNAAYVVNDAIVFRFPRREIAVELLAVETAFLPQIVQRVPLAVPDPRWLGTPSEAFDWPFAGYPLLPGRTACVADLSPQQRYLCAAPLGDFLRALHAIPSEEAGRWGVPPDTIRRLDLAHRLPQVTARFDQIERGGLADNVPAARAALARAQGEYSPGTRCLVHGDLYARHLIVDAAGTLTAVIDWGDAHRGDPAIDLAIAWSFLPPESRNAFLAAYGAITPAAWARARFKALYSMAMIIVYGHDIGDRVLQREGRIGLANAAAD